MPVWPPGSWHGKSTASLFKCSICCSPEDIPDVSVQMTLGVHQCISILSLAGCGSGNAVLSSIWSHRKVGARETPLQTGGWTPHFLTDLRFSLMSPSSALPRFLQVPTGSLWASASCAPCDSSLAGMREVGMRKVHGWRFISLQPAADVGLSPLGVGRKGFS